MFKTPYTKILGKHTNPNKHPDSLSSTTHNKLQARINSSLISRKRISFTFLSPSQWPGFIEFVYALPLLRHYAFWPQRAAVQYYGFLCCLYIKGEDTEYEQMAQV